MFNFYHLILTLFSLNEVGSFHTRFSDFYFESIHVVNTTSKVPFASINASLRRNGHDHPRIFFDFDLTESFKDYDTEAKLYYSPLGNRRFILMPFKCRRQPVCEVYKLDLSHQVLQSLQNDSNLPPHQVNVDYCDLMVPGHYFVHNHKLDPNLIPKITPTGTFRLLSIFYERNKNEVLQIIEFVATFT